MKKLAFLSALLMQMAAFSQPLTQTIRGTVIDKQSQMSLPGATVVLLGAKPLVGTTTDLNGNFELTDVAVGRHTLKVSFLGYLPAILPNVEVTSSKQVVLNIALEESVTQMKEVVVKAEQSKEKALNQMASVSARTFSVEESQRFAGSRNDVARMATNFAGVNAPNDATNDIVIRGNAPRGLLWRLNGIDIPNPNHFGNGGAAGGPVSMLNNNVLANSDFFTGAFPAEYGNAISGVFDLQMRNGNNQEHEFLGQIGFNGFELGAEGPLSKNKRGSYLINYRYSTLSVFDALGINIGTGAAVPQYQDLSFKLNLPTDKWGTFEFFGLGGTSYIEFISSDKDSADVEPNFYTSGEEDTYFRTNNGVVGLSNKYLWNNKTYSKVTLAASGIQNISEVDSVINPSRDVFRRYDSDLTRYRFTASLLVNHKVNAKHNWRAGAFINQIGYNLSDSVYEAKLEGFRTLRDESGGTQLIQPYMTWQYRPSNHLTLNAGVHTAFFALTNETSIEPRLGVSYSPWSRHTFSFGYGLHSQAAPLDIYFEKDRLNDGALVEPNRDLRLTKSQHFVLGYDLSLTSTMRFKAEAYYQDLSRVIVDAQNGPYSLQNEGTFDFTRPNSLNNDGSGYNYGVEFTLEKFLEKGFYFLTTVSLFESRYVDGAGVERNTAFNGNYVLNALGGKEFVLFQNNPEKSGKHAITVDSKLTVAGGNRFTPIDVKASSETGQTEFINNRAFTERLNDYFRWDIRVAYQLSKKKFTEEWAIDVQNVTNHENPFGRGFNQETQEVETINQLGIFPVVQYRITF